MKEKRLALLTWLSYAATIHKEVFTTNAVCRQKYCVNPIFPGLEDLTAMSEQQFFCERHSVASTSMSFCGAAVNYDTALPAPAAGITKEVPEIVKEQEQLAMTMYAYHLQGMGVEFWDATKPWETDDDCMMATWRLVCYTYFPKCDVNSEPGRETTFVRPCSSSCKNYVRECGVECCDESVSCVFSHQKTQPGGAVQTTEGYSAHDGPSSLCTGSAHAGGLWLVALLAGRSGWKAAGLAAAAMFLQGCDGGVPTHSVGNWRARDDYLLKFQYIPPGGAPTDAILNSCSLDRLAQTLQCSGRGICKPWDKDNLANPLMFCECDRDWADPECRSPRKSQVIAYLLSLFLGVFGADLFYLGFPLFASMKLCTFGGCGIWWLYDIVRVGSAPVYAHDYRVASDLPHWAFVLSVVMFTFALGLLITGCSTFRHIRSKRKEALLLQAEEALLQLEGPRKGQNYTGLAHAGYGSTHSQAHPYPQV